jgi:hypothetical protein
VRSAKSRPPDSLLVITRPKWGIPYSLVQIHWLCFAEGLLVVVIILLVVISLLTPPPAKEKERDTAFGTSPDQKAESRASWNKWDVVHSAVILGVVAVFSICISGRRSKLSSKPKAARPMLAVAIIGEGT